jgi:ribosomal protein L11 methyltransferase
VYVYNNDYDRLNGNHLVSLKVLGPIMTYVDVNVDAHVVGDVNVLRLFYVIAMHPNFIEVAIRAAFDADELIGWLQEEEALGSWEKDGTLHVYWPEERWSPGILERLKAALTDLGVHESAAEWTVQTISDQDWNAIWTASLKPIRIGKGVRIRQSWNPSDPEFKGIELVIDPKRAFGAGYHATTQMILEWLEDHIRIGERILDVGTGTGILAMTALRLGAASAVAIDIDPEAIECAQEYASVNGFGDELDLRILSFETGGLGRFDAVLANLDIRALPALANALTGLLDEDGVACLSGLLIQDYEEVAEALTRAHLKIMTRYEREEWMSLVVSRQ